MLALLFVALFVVFFYTVLHEGGHALVGVLSGQRLLVFNIDFVTMGAHVSLAGDLSAAQRALQTVAGVGLPLVVWAALMLAVPRRANPVLELLKIMGTLVALNSTLPWILFPLLVAAGQAPPRDDVLGFLGSSGVPPLVLAAAAVAVYVGGWALFAARVEGVRRALALVVGKGEELTAAAMRRALLPMAGVLAAGAAGVLALGLALGPAPDPLAPPPGYELAAEVSLRQQANSAGSVCGFTLEQPAEVGLCVILSRIDTPYIDIALEGPDGFGAPIMHGEGYASRADRMRQTLQLAPGAYRVVITNKPSPGTVAVYLKLPSK